MVKEQQREKKIKQALVQEICILSLIFSRETNMPQKERERERREPE